MRPRLSRPVISAFALLLLGSVALAAQQGPGRFADDEHRYDVDTVETLTGTVEEVLLRTGRAGAAGLHLLVSSGAEVIEVLVGPTFYVYPEGLEVDPGNEVTITGSRLSVDGRPLLMAREIQVDDFSLILRDEAGVPAWRGQGPESAAGRDDGPRRGPGTSAGHMGARGHRGHHGCARADRRGDGGRHGHGCRGRR